jgi:hypothetical protein
MKEIQAERAIGVGGLGGYLVIPDAERFRKIHGESPDDFFQRIKEADVKRPKGEGHSIIPPRKY